MSEKHPLIDLAGMIHIAIVVNDVQTAVAEWSKWTGIPVEKIVLITFTNAAAKELRKKIKTRGIIIGRIMIMECMRDMAFGKLM